MGPHRWKEVCLPFLLLVLAAAAWQAYDPEPVHAEEDLGRRYDSNGSNYIDRDEVLAAIVDYLDGELTRDDVFKLIGLHLSQAQIQIRRPTPMCTPPHTAFDRGSADALAAIEALPWTEDGDPEDVARLEGLSERSPQVFWALMDRDWIQGRDGELGNDTVSILRSIENLSRRDGTATACIVALQFLDTVERRGDWLILSMFGSLMRSAPDDVHRLLSDRALPEAVQPAQVALLYLESQGPAIVAAIEGMPWILDLVGSASETDPHLRIGLEDGLEHRALMDLFEIYVLSPEAFVGLARKPWVQDGINVWDYHVVLSIGVVAHSDPKIVARLVDLSFLDAVDSVDVYIIQTLELYRDGGHLGRIVDDPMLGGDIADGDLGNVALLGLRILDPVAAEVVDSLDWVRDGISESEQFAVHRLWDSWESRKLGSGSHRILQTVAQKSWLQDGLNPDELSVVTDLLRMSSRQNREDTIIQIIEMPFLETVDGVDAAAMTSLSRLDGEEFLYATLSHPTLSDGITDEDSVIVAALQEVIPSRPDLLEVLLNREEVTVENRPLELPHSGQVVASVIHLMSGATFRTMDIFERILRSQEGFMRIPFPRTHVGLLVADTTPHRGGGGPGGFGFIVDPAYEEDEALIAHELAHTYWPFSPRWIAEGGAEFRAAISAGETLSSSLDCGAVENLYELDLLSREQRQAKPPPPPPGWSSCPYVLGSALFLDLHESLGESASSAGFGRLYTALHNDTHEGECGGVERGACYVSIAFVREADEEAAAIAGPIIRRHYYGD